MLPFFNKLSDPAGTANVSEWYSMFVWAMGGVRQECYMTIWPSMESLATLETVTDEARFDISIPAETLLGKLLLCHTAMRHCQCFRVVQYVCLGHGWGEARVLHDNLAQHGVSCHT